MGVTWIDIPFDFTVDCFEDGSNRCRETGIETVKLLLYREDNS